MWVLALTLAALNIDDGGSQCPTGAAVAEAFTAVAGETAALRERVELRQIAAGVRLRLLDPNGAPLAERTLPGPEKGETCAELARAIAVVLAAWRTEVEAGTPKLAIKPPPPREKPSWELSAGFMASLAGRSFAAGGELEAAVGRRRWLLRLDAFGMDLRTVAVGRSTGHARFTRAGLQVGPMVRFRPRRWLFDLHAEATFALLYMDGVGFSTNHSANAFDLGLGLGARAAHHWGPVAPFLGITILGWPIGQSVVISGPAGGNAPLPTFEVWLRTGIAFGNY
jgi:hypothetical protein